MPSNTFNSCMEFFHHCIAQLKNQPIQTFLTLLHIHL
uniref:Uncharacterized protein n=1 Tax=Rhizophora mucronata TaxID=61149 RepID=A0A2P2Q393_RHIMU